MKVKLLNEALKINEAIGLVHLFDTNTKVFLNKFGYYEEILDSLNDYEINNDILKVLPIFNGYNLDSISNLLFKNIHGVNFDKKIGYFTHLYTGHVIEGTFRENGSSGGMTTWILKELFVNKLIDGVIHIHSFNSQNILFKYGISRNLSMIIDNSKTKYYPVELSEVLDEVKKIPGKYAIVGIPDVVSSIRSLSILDKDLKSRILFFIGLISGHQKSTKFTESLARQAGISPSELKDIDYRYKKYGSTSIDYGVKFLTVKDEIVIKPMSSFKEHDWGKGYFKLESSDYTDDVFNETADITFGDAWLEQFYPDTKGNNIVIVRNNIIGKLIKEGITSGKIKLDLVTPDIINLSQEAHYRHTHDELSYRLHKRGLKKLFLPHRRVESSYNISLNRRFIQNARLSLSINSHIQYFYSISKKFPEIYNKKMEFFERKYKNAYVLNHLMTQTTKNRLIWLVKKFFSR